MPPIAAAIGSAADRTLLRCPEVNSRLISSPTTRTNRVSRPSLIQLTSGSENRALPTPSDTTVSHTAVHLGPSGELVIANASRDARTSRTSADAAPLATCSARTRIGVSREPTNEQARAACLQGANLSR